MLLLVKILDLPGEGSREGLNNGTFEAWKESQLK